MKLFFGCYEENTFLPVFVGLLNSAFAQTKVDGIVVDKKTNLFLMLISFLKVLMKEL